MRTELIAPGALASYKRVAFTAAMAEANAETHARATHERFNIFTTLLKESDEVRLHTRFIHCLLDPRGSHDCGSMFLDLFFETLAAEGVIAKNGVAQMFTPPAPGSEWTVLKEASRSPHGQIDLLLESSARFGIAIENKIHAGEQATQLSGYGTYLSGRHGERHHLIYLTLDGKAAYTAGDHAYLRISYERHILRWLEACLRETYRIVPVNQVILQYRSVVRRLTHQPPDHEFMKPVLDFIRDNPEILRHQELISKAVTEIRGDILNQFATGLISALSTHGVEVQPNPGNRNGSFGSDPCGSLWLTPPPGSVLRALPFRIWLEIWNQQLLVGLKVPDLVSNQRAEIQHLLREMNQWMNEQPARSESRLSSPNPAWPTGWDVPVSPLNDDLIADWLQQDAMDDGVARVSEAVLNHIRLLESAYTDATAGGPQSHPME